MNNFQRCFSEYKHDLSLMLILHGINVCYYFYILWCHFSRMILTIGEMITATLKVILATTKVILTTEEVITTTLKVISTTTKYWPLKK